MFEHIRFLLAFSMLDKIGPIIARELLAYFGSAEQVFSEPITSLRKIHRIGPVLAQEIHSNKALIKADKELEFIVKNNISIAAYTDKNYPARLLHCEDAPLLFFYKGNVDFNAQKIISIVGTRNATQYGIELCNNLISKLAYHNPIIVSGLAYGIDIAAHKAAITHNLQTIAVIGNPLNKISPAPHIKYAKDISQHGCVLSEYNTQMPFEKSLFVRRNRIIAGLSDATIVVESRIKGGALFTADFAQQYSRDVFAFPGNIGSVYSEGCNQLIKENKAALIEGAEDIEKQLNWDLANKKHIQKNLFVELNADEESIFNCIKKNNEITIDQICNQTMLSMSKTSAILLSLEFQGLVKALAGKRFKIT